MSVVVVVVVYDASGLWQNSWSQGYLVFTERISLFMVNLTTKLAGSPSSWLVSTDIHDMRHTTKFIYKVQWIEYKTATTTTSNGLLLASKG